MPHPEFVEEPTGSDTPWVGGFGIPVENHLLLARSSDGALLLRSLVAYPQAFVLELEAQLRRPLRSGAGTRGNNHPKFGRSSGSREAGLIEVGIRLSDGSVHRNLDPEPTRLRGPIRSDASGSISHATYWFAPLPPPGDLELYVSWPAGNIEETMIRLDASSIREAAQRTDPLWPLP